MTEHSERKRTFLLVARSAEGLFLEVAWLLRWQGISPLLIELAGGGQSGESMLRIAVMCDDRQAGCLRECFARIFDVVSVYADPPEGRALTAFPPG